MLASAPGVGNLYAGAHFRLITYYTRIKLDISIHTRILREKSIYIIFFPPNTLSCKGGLRRPEDDIHVNHFQRVLSKQQFENYLLFCQRVPDT